jgi:D-lactate dehydrogenase
MNKITHITAFATRVDEIESFEKFSKQLNLSVNCISDQLSQDNIKEAEGTQAITIVGSTIITRSTLIQLSAMGVSYIATRSIGYNNIDIEAATELGFKISNTQYSPNSVADFALMLALMVNRRVISCLKRNVSNDFTIEGLRGVEMKDMRVGVIGTGRIGATVIKNFSGLGCEIIGYDIKEREDIKQYMKYVSLDELLSTSDIISLHTPLFESTYHLINKESIAKMKKGVKIINTARGELIDTKALIDGLKTGHIGGVGLDVIENEEGTYLTPSRIKIISNDDIAILKSFDNVVLTPHIAFYTDNALSDMVYYSLLSLKQFINTGKADFQVN